MIYGTIDYNYFSRNIKYLHTYNSLDLRRKEQANEDPIHYVQLRDITF